MDWRALWLSLQVSLAATALAAVVGVGLAWWLAQRGGGWREWLDAAITAPMVLPPTVLGYYLLVLVGRSSALGGAWEWVFGGSLVFSRAGAVLAAFVGALPLIVRASRAALEGVDPRLVEAARVCGASPWGAFVGVTLPLARGGVLAGVTLGFARALGDFGATLMVAGNLPGLTQTAPLSIYDAVQAGREGEAAGMAALLTAFAVAALVWSRRLAPPSR